MAPPDPSDSPARPDSPAPSDSPARPAEPAPSDMRRPGGRTARVRAAVLRAAEDALVEVGFAGLDLGDVARRAEVGRTTVYRRWGTVGALLADLLTAMAEQSLPRARTGSLHGDLRANARLVRSTLADPRQGALFRAVLVAAEGDAAAAEAVRHFYRVRVAEWAPCVSEAVERGELPAGTDPEEVVRAVSAPLYYRMLTTSEPLDEAAADRAAAAAEAAARAGAYRRPGPSARAIDASAADILAK